MVTKLVVPDDQDAFARAAILDYWGDTIALSSDTDHKGLACLQFTDKEDGSSVSAYLNRSAVVMLRAAFDLWLDHLDVQADVAAADEEDDDDD